MTSQPVTLVLGGGGLKGLAHIGVFQALSELGITPSLVIGSSMGALIAATWATGMSESEMEARALLVTRKNVFRVAHFDMALRRMRSPAIYRREPLDELIVSLIGERTFGDLERPLLVNTVDLHAGRQVFWGLPGRRDALVSDAVFASCALPGIFPPRRIGKRSYVDGAVIENLPVRLAAVLSSVPVVAVNLSGFGTERRERETRGFAATYIRGLEIVMQSQIEGGLRGWSGPPLLLVQPRVANVSMFAFNKTASLIREGRRATVDAFAALPASLHELDRGLHPRQDVVVEVDREACIGCGLCVHRAPMVFTQDEDGKAVVLQPHQNWGPLGAPYVRECPTRAITAEPAAPR